jgi:hypothetical protein
MTKKALVVTSLLGLTLVDVLWALVSGRFSPLAAAAAFGVVAGLVGMRDDFRAGLIVGVAGVAVHIFELIFHGRLGVSIQEASLFAANLCLSVIVVWCSWDLLRRRATPEATKRRGGRAQAT